LFSSVEAMHKPVGHDARVAPIEIRDLTKRYGKVTAVSGLSFEVEAGRVTGFLGPNGAGKTTTLRALLGLIGATSGTATIFGRPYADLERPTSRVGAVLEDTAFHPGRTGRNHLRVLAAAGGHSPARVPELLKMVGLVEAADRRVKGYSLGMRQRLAIASALIGDPDVLVLDEPANGLDPPGIQWMRSLLRHQASLGRTVLVSSHVLAEVAQSVDDVVVIAGGSMRGAGTLHEVLGGASGPVTEVRVRDLEPFRRALEGRGLDSRTDEGGTLVVGAAPEQVGEIAAAEGAVLTHLSARARSLEAAFMELTA
jgi:ABC-2 type transport system ATP-binding protein